MAKGSGSRGQGGSRRPAGAKGSPKGSSKGKRPAPAARAPRRQPSAPAPEAPEEPGTFRLGVIPGATPGKWIDTWRERMPAVELELSDLAVAGQRAALLSGEVDAALVRLPLDGEELHVIPLYDETPVVVMSADSDLTVAEELEPADLAGEVLIVPADDVLSPEVAGTVAPVFAAPADAAEAIATVAAGVGVVIVPMSLARMHHRKDVEYRVLRSGPVSTVALAWVRDATTRYTDAFVGIVRGRTANSSR